MASRVDVACNGASRKGLEKPLALDYRPKSQPTVNLGLPSFAADLLHVPKRTLDLLEVAAYIYAADRHTSRGPKAAVEYHSWARSFRFRVRVRDLAFWRNAGVRRALSECLVFLTGDADFEFEFEGGHSTPPSSLFDRDGFVPAGSPQGHTVALFSGGLDSLAGAIRHLTGAGTPLWLVSHQSQTGVVKTQRGLVAQLQRDFPGRVSHYSFECTLAGTRAQEETQRSRSFLYSSIGFALAQACGAPSLDIYENGVTSLNLRRREDLGNARASRTTNPKALALVESFLRMVGDEGFTIRTPSFWMTKRDVVRELLERGYGHLITSSVSCSRTFQREGDATHCGRCFQCIDRRLAVYAAEADEMDEAGLYTTNIIDRDIEDAETRTTLVDYLRQAARLAEGNVDLFAREYLADLAGVLRALPLKGSQADRLDKVWDLLRRHGESVKCAIQRMRRLHDDPMVPLPRRSLLGLVSDREHLQPELVRLARAIGGIVQASLGRMFRFVPPRNENDLNSKIAALLAGQVRLSSEYPSVQFACATAVPDHSIDGVELFVEAKYVRKGTSPSKAAEGMAADLTKYGAERHILFLVYDPTHRIADDAFFVRDFEAFGRCTVIVVR